jgi:hypothetical protein
VTVHVAELLPGSLTDTVAVETPPTPLTTGETV